MKKIDWTKWSAIAEVLSSVAIVATLLYLVIQTQQNAAAIQASSRQTMLMADWEVLQLSPNDHLQVKEDLSILEMEELFKFLNEFSSCAEGENLLFFLFSKKAFAIEA